MTGWKPLPTTCPTPRSSRMNRRAPRGISASRPLPTIMRHGSTRHPAKRLTGRCRRTGSISTPGAGKRACRTDRRRCCCQRRRLTGPMPAAGRRSISRKRGPAPTSTSTGPLPTGLRSMPQRAGGCCSRPTAKAPATVWPVCWRSRASRPLRSRPSGSWRGCRPTGSRRPSCRWKAASRPPTWRSLPNRTFWASA